MMEAEIKFERENRNGVIAVGSYLFDAARRLGIDIEAECERQGMCDSCAVTITRGKELLSETTKAEAEHLSAARRKNGERLSCQAKIEKSGEIVVMTTKKEEPEVDKNEEYRKEFTEMPLEEKISNLVKLEAIAFGETFAYVLNSPYKIGEKIMDVMAEFGFKMEEEAKEAKRPKEHQEEEKNGDAKSEKETAKTAPKSKTSTRKTPPKRTSGSKKAKPGDTKEETK